MQQFFATGLILTTLVALAACQRAGKNNPGKIYMPDMAYSRALETYADNSHLAAAGIRFEGTPVPGTVKREGVAAFPLPMDQGTETTNYDKSVQIANPLPALNDKDMAEARRLYNVNCGICHGEKLDGNGPLYKGGDGPYPAKPATLVGDAKYEAMPAGQMMYSLTYGKNLMGSYAAQLSTKQRWMIIHYIKSMQPGGKPATDAVAAN
ncbi:MAG TPA: cytochrome c [Lacibacter sp.]|nr:cytochrome c [Lacibacter sp.]HMO88348.1 cytochrome c [Lacibacter sp.]HMP86733.1 cytochrome c [Lacibacter sp.]